MFKLASLTGVALALLSTVATAADLPSRKAPPAYIPPPPVMTWTGFYIGLNAGAGFRNNNNNNNNLFFGGGFGGFNNNNNNNRVAFVGGGQLGYNWQTGPVVFGIETDFQYRGRFANNNNNFFFGNNNNQNGGFLGTTRGRLGYAFTPAFMLYATGGVAYGHTDNNNFNNFFGGFGGFGFGGFNNNNNNFRVGYTVGGGAEFMFAPNWSIKAEYLFVDLGNNNNNGFNFGFNNNNNRFQFHVARAGINYRFNWAAPAPVVARY